MCPSRQRCVKNKENFRGDWPLNYTPNTAGLRAKLEHEAIQIHTQDGVGKEKYIKTKERDNGRSCTAVKVK